MKMFWDRFKRSFLSHTFLWSCVISLFIATVLILYYSIFEKIKYGYFSFGETFFDIVFVSVFFIYPIVLTLLNVIFLFNPHQGLKARHSGKIIEFTTIIIGTIFTVLYQANIIFSNIIFSADYYVQLYNNQKHTPIFTGTWPTLITILFASLVGYLILRVIPISRQSPLVTVLSMSAMYMGMALCAVFIIQLFSEDFEDNILCLLPFNLIIITLKVIREITIDWKKAHPANDESQFGGKTWLLSLNKLLCRACVLPIVALILALPLLGVIIALLTLCGQAPNSIIQAWTQTADWNLSQQTAPMNLYYDEHYLCTVAVGGHPKIVKPLRNGKRHGHEIIVNRQLCVANAFEQLLEERAPRFHKCVRCVYDKYGYPIARHIKTKTAADIVYFIMKPLECCFLVVLYLCDVNPEDRIAVQYPHAPLPKFSK